MIDINVPNFITVGVMAMVFWIVVKFAAKASGIKIPIVAE